MAQSPNGYTGHQLPPLPPTHQDSYASQNSQQAQRPAPRPSSKSGFSFHSNKSRGSTDGPKVDLVESPREKAARRLSTKADPRMALSEQEPSALANDHSSVLGNLRAMQHRDQNGLPIVDPDRSNPTRSRWERPLDTIRGFEAAIDGNYTRKSSNRSEAPDSRRGSYYAASTVKPMNNGYSSQPNRGYGNKYSEGRYYGGYENRNNVYRDGYESRPDSYYGNNDSNNGYYPSRARVPRNGSEPMLNGYFEDNRGRGNGAVYPPNGNPQSYETVTTASGSGSSSDRDRTGYETHPSSDNSSFDRVAVPQTVSRKPNYADEYPQAQQAMGDYFNQPQEEQYDLRSPGQSYPSQQQGYSNGGGYANGNGNANGYAVQQSPQVPPHTYQSPQMSQQQMPQMPQQQQQGGNRPMPPPKHVLSKSNSSASRPAADGGKERKSWFGKKFGKK